MSVGAIDDSIHPEVVCVIWKLDMTIRNWQVC
jgi:hypothetical protein